MGSQDDVPLRRREIRNIITLLGCYSLFVLSLLIWDGQKVDVKENLPKVTQTYFGRVNEVIDQHEQEEHIYLQVLKRTGINRKIILEPIVNNRVATLSNIFRYKKIPRQTVEQDDLYYVIDYIQATDGKKRTHFL